jgi:hypothetical protein
MQTLRGNLMAKATEWESFNPLFKRTLITGEVVKADLLMRRRDENGKWIYRRPTSDEIDEEMSVTAW